MRQFWQRPIACAPMAGVGGPGDEWVQSPKYSGASSTGSQYSNPDSTQSSGDDGSPPVAHTGISAAAKQAEDEAHAAAAAEPPPPAAAAAPAPASAPKAAPPSSPTKAPPPSPATSSSLSSSWFPKLSRESVRTGGFALAGFGLAWIGAKAAGWL